MVKEMFKNQQRFPGSFIDEKAEIAEGAKIGERCRIERYCQISDQTVIEQNVALFQNVQILGDVSIDMGAVIRENVTLVGPLHICAGVFIGHDSIIGAIREDSSLADKTTLIGQGCRIGKAVEVIGGVEIGAYTRIRANSKVIGDVPQYAIISRFPAILERFGCPECAGNLQIFANNGRAILVKCSQCNQGEIRFTARDWSDSPNHVLLSASKLGDLVSTLGEDLRWLDEWETR